ncbi:hypothetical protein, conserved [Leishmania tarentolae]|uniref:Haloacid dehalogenase-like hydrolase n=1 Tax=Leishmania tarentolae TaxID=5689 RepID=A0A640KVA6_LEITA|nr:hypothetical protein, conserved [Leishmania tarentolae]
MLRNALSCFASQLELATMTNTVPADIEYKDVAQMVNDKLQNAPGNTLGVFDHLKAKEILLPEPDNPTYAIASMSAPLTVFLFDIEGTTTPLPFVQNVMIPLAEARVEAYMAAHFPEDKEFVKILTQVVEPQSSPLTKASTARSKGFTDALAVSEARGWKDEEANKATRTEFCTFFHEEVGKGSEHAAVKAVQAAIWADVFAEGKVQSQVFPDVDTFFRFAGGPSMTEKTRIALYSSGNIAAQKLYMGHTPYGDLNPFITAYFDPMLVGTKLMPKSYMKIRTLLAEELDIPSDCMQIVFVTDNTSEASAADTSGAVECSVLCVRPLNKWITFDTMLSINVPYIMSFTQLMQRNYEVDMGKLVRDTEECMKQHSTA